MIKSILVTMPAAEEYRKKLQLAAPNAVFVYIAPKNLSEDDIQAADIIIGNPPAGILNHASRLRLLQLVSAGAEHYLKIGQILPDVKLCCASGAFGLMISEHMMGMLLCLMKKLHICRDDQAQGKWARHGSVPSVYGARVLIIGLGDIGSSFAGLCKAMGAHVTGVKRTAAPKPDYADELHTQEALDDLLPLADVVALCLPETHGTLQLMNRQRIGSMKPGAYLLNVGRGSAVDQDALLQAVRESRLAGAGLDVTTPEPLPPDAPLWHEKNILISPHVSGQFNAKITQDRIFDIACHNIRALINGTPFISLVDFEAGY